MNQIGTINNPLLDNYILRLRDRRTATQEFRLTIKKISALLCYPVSELLESKSVLVETLYGMSEGRVLKRPLAIFPVMRSGLLMSSVIEEYLEADLVCPLGIRRSRESLLPEVYYTNMPDSLASFQCIIIDPILATGNIICTAIKMLKQRGADTIYTLSVIGAPEGVLRVGQTGVNGICCKIDECLNEEGYIVPGLGDVGDRAFGSVDNAKIYEL